MADDDTKQEDTEGKEDQEDQEGQEGKDEKEEQKTKAPSQPSEPSEPSKPSVKVSAKLGKIIEEIEKLSVLELSELVKALEEKFGVTAAAPAAAAAVPQAAGAEEGPGEEQTTFNVILADAGANKIAVIKAIREIVPTLGLKEAKDLADSAPKPVIEGVNKETAQEAKTKLEAAGGKVELK